MRVQDCKLPVWSSMSSMLDSFQSRLDEVVEKLFVSTMEKKVIPITQKEEIIPNTVDWTLSLTDFPEELQFAAMNRENPLDVWKYLRDCKKFPGSLKGVGTVFVFIKYSEGRHESVAKMRVDSPLDNPQCSWCY